MDISIHNDSDNSGKAEISAVKEYGASISDEL